MGLYDRDYARSTPPAGSGAALRGGATTYDPRRWSMTAWLVTINIAVAVLGIALMFLPGDRGWTAVPTGVEWDPATTQQARDFAVPDPTFSKDALKSAMARAAVVPLYDRRNGQLLGRAVFTAMSLDQAWGHFSTYSAFSRYEIWRFVTFQFLHFGWVHLAFNLIALWTFGPDVEEYLGRKRYLALYLVCGICGALSYLILNGLGNLFPNAGLPGLLIGDTRTPLVGASAGIFGIMLAAAFVVPQRVIELLYIIPMRTKPAVYLFFGVAVINLLIGSSNAGGEAAHVGGAIAGSYFIRHMYHLRDFFDFFGEGDSKSNVDDILAKISTHGHETLTDREKSLLRKATQQANSGLPTQHPASQPPPESRP